MAITTPAKLAIAEEIPIISAVDVFFTSGLDGTTTSLPGITLGNDLKNKK